MIKAVQAACLHKTMISFLSPVCSAMKRTRGTGRVGVANGDAQQDARADIDRGNAACHVIPAWRY